MVRPASLPSPKTGGVATRNGEGENGTDRTRLDSEVRSEPLESIDKFALQTHVNDLARRYSQDGVKHARSYLKSIFDEAIEQEFLSKDSTRKLKIPSNLRPKDKQVLTCGAAPGNSRQCSAARLASAHARNDRRASLVILLRPEHVVAH